MHGLHRKEGEEREENDFYATHPAAIPPLLKVLGWENGGKFIWYPERLERNKQLRQERGGWRAYYDKTKRKEYMKDHRHYKQNIFINSKS